MEKNFELVGVEIPEIWSTSDCSSHQKIKKQIDEGKVVAIVRKDKLKLFGKDANGILRCKAWPLGSNEPEVEASLIVERTFGLSLKHPDQKVIHFPEIKMS